MGVKRHLIGAGNIVDISALVVVVEHRTDCKLVLDDRNIHEHIASDAVVTALGHRIAAVEAGLELFQIGLVGDVADRAAHRTCAKQRTLRSGQHFDALEIGGVKIEIASDQRGRSVVDVKRNTRRGSGSA